MYHHKLHKFYFYQLESSKHVMYTLLNQTIQKSNTEDFLLISTHKLASENAIPSSLPFDQTQQWDMNYEHTNHTYKSELKILICLAVYEE